MVENVGNQPTASDDVIGDKSTYEVIVGNIVDDIKAIRHPSGAKIHTLSNEEESREVMKRNKTAATTGEIILKKNQQITKSVVMEGDTNEMYPCQICLKVVKSKVSFNYHMKKHSKQKNVTCQQCNYLCISAETLKKHRKTHMGEKSFICQVCLKSFTHSSAFIYHRQTHTG